MIHGMINGLLNAAAVLCALCLLLAAIGCVGALFVLLRQGLPLLWEELRR